MVYKKTKKKYNFRKIGGYKKKKTTSKRKNEKKHHNKSIKNYKPKCAPNPNKTLDFTCYTNDSLYKLKEIWNARHPDIKIDDSNPKNIWLKLREYMKDTCNNEMCWIKQTFIKQEIDKDILNYTFAPEAPEEWNKNPQEWLSSLDILNVMKQYEKKYKCFEFMGPSPIDFDTHKIYGDCVWEELCHFSLKEQIYKNKNKIGIIFNLDPHYKPGSHWVALFINIKNSTIYYFDSYGLKPHSQIKKFINNIIKQGKLLNINFRYDYNKTRHQYSNSECGMYSLHFIIENLNDMSINKLFDKKIDDKQMIKLRNIYFN
jgi:hypothetical protein